MKGATFPTTLHADVAHQVTSFFEGREGVEAVLVIASCARGTAVPESDLDMAVLIAPERRDVVEHEWEAFRDSSEAIRALTASNRFAALHLDLIDGEYHPVRWDDGGGPDDFELEIGNHVAYSAPLWEGSTKFEQLKIRWLPYYEEPLRRQRLAMVREACLNDLEFVPFYVRRDMHFQAFDRLYKAFREFLQGLFISQHIYPIAYNKWIREQVCDLLSAPELYAELPRVLEVPKLEGSGLLTNHERLLALATEWLGQ